MKGVILAVIAASLIGAAPALASAPATQYSGYWSGYVRLGAPGSQNSVRATLQLPQPSCGLLGYLGEPHGSKTAYWVGFDGWETPDVEQVGITEFCAPTGRAAYIPWVENFRTFRSCRSRFP